MNTSSMWKLTNRLTGQEIYCEKEPPMDNNPFDGWNPRLWQLDPPQDKGDEA